MDDGLHTGDMLLVKKYKLDRKETGGSLFDKLASFGGPMILEVLKQAEEGKLNPVKQDESKQTYAKMLSKATGEIDFSKTAKTIRDCFDDIGYLDVKELQLEGKKRMNIAAFLRGYKVEKGETLNG